MSDKILFVTGRLAEHALRSTVEQLARSVGFDYHIQVLPITVAALLTPRWIAPRLQIPPDISRIILPGYCDGDLQPLRDVTDLPITVGPKDLRDLPQLFGRQKEPAQLDQWTIEILAEINHAPRLELDQIIEMAKAYAADGADWIDIGCEPNGCWTNVADAVKAVRELGLRVSIDSLNPQEIGPAVTAGAELVLSVNSTNREAAQDWGVPVVVIPDDISRVESMDETIELLAAANIPLRIDPILEPIGLGFATSLQRYMQARQRWPEAEMMMGIGNLTELSDVDSSGVNFLLLGICQELKINSILTTQVINWSRSSVRECDLARRLVHYAVQHQVPPKNLSDQLVTLRDHRLVHFAAEQLADLAIQIKDNNYRIFAEQDEIHLLGGGHHFHNRDPFILFDQLAQTNPSNLSPSHAFYLGYEMSKALTSLTLGKQYTQDEALNWGHLTETEKNRHRLKKRFRTPTNQNDPKSKPS